jgi:hypothetical protein
MMKLIAGRKTLASPVRALLDYFKSDLPVSGQMAFITHLSEFLFELCHLGFCYLSTLNFWRGALIAQS